MGWRVKSWIVSIIGCLALAVSAGAQPSRGNAAAAVLHVQSKVGYVNSGRAVSATLDQPVVSGDLVVAYLVWSNTAGATLSDSRGDGYLPAGVPRTTWASGYSAEVFYAKNVAGGTTTVKAVLSSRVSFAVLYVHEYAGVDKDDPLDRARATSGVGTQLDSGPITTTHANDLLFGAGASVGSVSAGGSGYTVRSLAEGNITEDRAVTSTGSYRATATHGGGGWVMQVAAFKLEGSAGDTTPPTTPTNLRAQSVSTHEVDLAWTPATDNVAVAGYTVYRDGIPIATADSPSYADAGVEPATNYSYTVSAFDAAGNTSGQADPVSVTTPNISSGCDLPSYPDATCTGIPAGTPLTVVSGDVTISTPGAVVDGKDIRGCVVVNAPGVVIRRSRIACDNSIVVASFGGAYTGTGLLIEDSEITCNETTGTAVGDTNFTARRVNIHGCENGFDIDGEVVIADSYIHDLYNTPTSHTDGAQLTDIAHDVSFVHNTIYAGDGTSAIISPPVSGGIATNILVQDNLLAGGAYTLYCEQDGSGTNYRVVDNHFSTIFYPTVGAFGPWTDCGDEAVVTGNVYHETGLPLVP